MNLDDMSIATKTTVESERQSYRSPRLTIFGSIASLTATGTSNGMEDGLQNGICLIAPINMTFNMC